MLMLKESRWENLINMLDAKSWIKVFIYENEQENKQKLVYTGPAYKLYDENTYSEYKIEDVYFSYNDVQILIKKVDY